MGTMEGFSRETLCRVWTSNFLTVAGGIRDAGAIVRACGLDPGVATRQDMDDLEPLLEHPVHDTEENMKSPIGSRTTRRIHSWRSALRFQRAQPEYSADEWVMLNPSDTSFAKSVRPYVEISRRNTRSTTVNTIICENCSSGFNKSMGFAKHVAEEHGHSYTHDDWKWTPLLACKFSSFEETFDVHLPELPLPTWVKDCFRFRASKIDQFRRIWDVLSGSWNPVSRDSNADVGTAISAITSISAMLGRIQLRTIKNNNSDIRSNIIFLDILLTGLNSEQAETSKKRYPKFFPREDQARQFGRSIFGFFQDHVVM